MLREDRSVIRAMLEDYASSCFWIARISRAIDWYEIQCVKKGCKLVGRFNRDGGPLPIWDSGCSSIYVVTLADGQNIVERCR